MSKTPPNSKQAEEALLGCLLAGSDYITEAAGSMSADMFYYPDNQKIMRAILAVHASGKPVDIITAANELKRQIGSDEGRILIMELSSAVMSDMNVAAYAKVVIQKYINREAIRRAMEIQEAALSDDLDTVISESSKMGDELLNILPSSSSADISAVFAENIKEIDARVAGHSRSVYIDCNIRAIDRVIGGFDQGSLVIIAGRPSMGKTAMALQLAFNMSSLHACLFFTLEMTREEIVNRYLVALTSIDIIRLKRATSLTGDEWKLIEKAGKELEDHTIIIDDSATLSIYNLKAKIYRMVRSRGVRVVFIDYLQLMEGAKGKDTVEYYGSISRTCKQIAKELKIVIILLSQLSRDIERRGEKIPRLHDLRSSGEIEQDADIVMFPVRCDRAGIDDPSKGLGPGKAVISIAKNRNGMVDNVVINVSSNAANWWDENDIFLGPTTPPVPSFIPE